MSTRPHITIYEPPVIPLGRPAAVLAEGPVVGLRRRVRGRRPTRRTKLADLFAEKRALEARLEHVMLEIAIERGERL